MTDSLPPNRIRELRKQRGFSQTRLAEMLSGDHTHSLIAKVETGQQPLTHQYMLEIAAALGVRPIDIIQNPGGGFVELPLIGVVAAGNWREAIQEVTDWVAVPSGLGGASSFALTVDGDSMDNIVGDGGFVVVDPAQLDLSSGSVYIISNGEHETTFKRYAEKPPRLEPCSSNPDHKTIPVGREPFVVIGRVVFAGTRL